MHIWVWEGTHLGAAGELLEAPLLYEGEKFYTMDQAMLQQKEVGTLASINPSINPKATVLMLCLASSRVPFYQDFPQKTPKFQSLLCVISTFSSSKHTYPLPILSTALESNLIKHFMLKFES